MQALVCSSLDEAILDNRAPSEAPPCPGLTAGAPPPPSRRLSRTGYKSLRCCLSSVGAAHPNTWKEASPHVSDHTRAGFVRCVSPISPASPRGPKLPRKERRGGALLHHQLPVLQSSGRPSDADFFNPRLVTGPTVPTATSLSLSPPPTVPFYAK